MHTVASWKPGNLALYVYCGRTKKSDRCRELLRRTCGSERLLRRRRNPPRSVDWLRRGTLGLFNTITREQFHALCENRNPNDAERLTQRQQKENKRRVFYDFTCSAPKSVSVLAVTLNDGRLVGEEKEFQVFDSLSWTEAQKQDARQYRPGMALRFHRSKAGFDNGESAEVVGVVNGSLKVQRLDGTEGLFPLGRGAASFDVGETRKLKVAAGDKLLLQANWQKQFINGELVEVKAIQDGALVLADGRVIPENYRTFHPRLRGHVARGARQDGRCGFGRGFVPLAARCQSGTILRQHLTRAGPLPGLHR